MDASSGPTRLIVDASVPARLNVDASVPAHLNVDASVDLTLQFVEHCEAVSVCGVADLVGEPREAVDGHHGDDIRRELEPIGFEHVERASLHGAPVSAILPDRRGSR